MDKKKSEEFTRAVHQVHSFYGEIGILAKKSPDSLINEFKLNFINDSLNDMNAILEDKKPFKSFSSFDLDKLPSSSDVVVILAQYLKSAANFYNENTVTKYGKTYLIEGGIEIERLVFLELLNR